jgi:hypothetical protein
MSCINAPLGPSKRWKRKVCQDPTPSDTPADSDIELAVPLMIQLKRMRNKVLIICCVLVISLKTTVEKNEYDV